MKIEVVYSSWSAEDERYDGGVHDDVKVTKGNAPTFAAAEAAGVIVIVEASRAERQLLKAHVQSQEDGEAAYEQMQKEGRWQHGNLTQFVQDREASVAAGKDLPADERAVLELELAEGRILLEAAEVPE